MGRSSRQQIFLPLCGSLASAAYTISVSGYSGNVLRPIKEIILNCTRLPCISQPSFLGSGTERCYMWLIKWPDIFNIPVTESSGKVSGYMWNQIAGGNGRTFRASHSAMKPLRIIHEHWSCLSGTLMNSLMDLWALTNLCYSDIAIYCLGMLGWCSISLQRRRREKFTPILIWLAPDVLFFEHTSWSGGSSLAHKTRKKKGGVNMSSHHVIIV